MNTIILLICFFYISYAVELRNCSTEELNSIEKNIINHLLLNPNDKSLTSNLELKHCKYYCNNDGCHYYFNPI